MVHLSSTDASDRAFSAAAFQSGLKTASFGRVLHLRQRIGSTNALALSLAEQDAPEGTVVLADAQSRGRGRQGRAWISPPGVNLYFSVVLRPPTPAPQNGLLSLCAAGAVAEAIEAFSGLPARIKWPNDVLVHEKKIAGLLLEGSLRNNKHRHLVLGVGVNVNLNIDTLPDVLRPSATSLRGELGRDLDRIALFGSLMEHLEGAYRIFLAGPPQKLVPALAARTATIGQRVRIQTAAGDWSARAAGLAPDGALIVHLSDGSERAVRAEDVVHIRGHHAACD